MSSGVVNTFVSKALMQRAVARTAVMRKVIAVIGMSVLVALPSIVSADEANAIYKNPHVTITQADVDQIRHEINNVDAASNALQRLQEKVDALIDQPLDVPVPKDAGGGYTHEQHKRNYQTLYDAGLLFQLTSNERYLNFAKQVFMAYVELYPTIGIHPKRKEQSPGRLFWQSLNEAVWLVYVSQAYDMIASGLTESEQEQIETQLLRPVAKFLSEGQPKTFNKIHNHGTWAAAAVGMTGYAIGDETYVKQALYGLDMSGDAGFLEQINQLFSPDGYYAEGPYYQRYALMPFVLFAKAIQVNQPELKIFEYRDQVLLKAIRTAVQLSYNKLFFGINDAIKDKGIDTTELVHGIAIAYELTEDPTLLSIARLQDYALLTGYGFKVAKSLQENLDQPFEYQSMQLKDGINGDQGALTIFRNGIEFGHQALVMKNTSQGLGHGHFDKLHWLYFDKGNEIISDYGAARFLNIEAKYGGHYLPENNAWAKQTVAHNTVVVDEQSHFDGDWKRGQQSAPKVHFFHADDQLKITSASIDDAYPDAKLQRTMAMINHPNLEHPLVIDVFNVTSDSAHDYDLPLHYQGHLMSNSMPVNANSKILRPLGKNNGYQYLWNKADSRLPAGMSQVTWLNDGRFYTYSVLGGDKQKLVFAQLGANDPNFNLRPDSALIHRVKSTKSHTFVSVLETHGEYNGRFEYTVNAKSRVKNLINTSYDGIELVKIELDDGKGVTLAIATIGDVNTQHKIEVGDQQFEWVGHYQLFNSISDK